MKSQQKPAASSQHENRRGKYGAGWFGIKSYVILNFFSIDSP
jgi:hypothetical protein